MASYNLEILFSYGHSFEYYFGLFGEDAENQIFRYSEDLYDMYEKADLRKLYLTYEYEYDAKNFKLGNIENHDTFAYALRTAEFYLNRAEAYIEKGDPTSGMADINTVRKERYSSDKKYELTPNSEKSARELVREERRREFCFEGHRWFDIRRWGLSLERTYVLPQKNGQETYILKANDPAYTLPIPEEVRLTEPDLERINRPIRNPQK